MTPEEAYNKVLAIIEDVKNRLTVDPDDLAGEEVISRIGFTREGCFIDTGTYVLIQRLAESYWDNPSELEVVQARYVDVDVLESVDYIDHRLRSLYWIHRRAVENAGNEAKRKEKLAKNWELIKERCPDKTDDEINEVIALLNVLNK